MKIGIRKATVKDYPALLSLFDEIDVLHRDNLPDIFQKPKGPARELDFYLYLISEKGHGLFIAIIDRNIVGFGHAIVKEAADIPILVPRRYVIVDSIVVKSEYKNQGIGRMLMEAMEEWAAKEGATSIELNVYEFNAEAINFYGKLGYRNLSRKLSKDL